jgi:RNA recognition motif. (a.k.a. RRM, RBD, or RNP domain)
VKVLLDEATRECRGVGFVNYLDAGAAISAVNALHGARIGESRLLHVSLQTHRSKSSS